MSAIAGCLPCTTPAPDGILTWDLIEPLIRPKIYYRSQTGLIELESTHNMHGGSVYPPEIIDDICDQAHAAGIPVHLDGARIFNAATALGKSVAEITRKFDSVMFCLSKGLGAPVGSMLVGSRDFIDKARIGTQNARRRYAPGGRARGGGPGGARRNAQNAGLRPRKRALPGGRPGANQGNSPRSRKRSSPTS